jgi:hypothetical protein
MRLSFRNEPVNTLKPEDSNICSFQSGSFKEDAIHAAALGGMVKLVMAAQQLP